MSDTGKCLEINTKKTIDYGETIKHTSYEEYIERLRREEHLKHPNLIIEHKKGDPITAEGYAHGYVYSQHMNKANHMEHKEDTEDKDTLYAVFFTLLILAFLLFGCGVCAYFFGRRNSYQDPTA